MESTYMTHSFGYAVDDRLAKAHISQSFLGYLDIHSIKNNRTAAIFFILTKVNVC
jgi:hypothetical protein